MKNKEIVIGGISTKERLILVKQLYAGIKAGYPITEALKITLNQAKGRLKQILSEVIQMVEGGAYLNEAFAKHSKYFPPLFINLIKTGEISGSLEENLKQLSEDMGKEMEFRQKIKSALTYPTFVFIAVLGLGLSVSFFILPNLIPLFNNLDAKLPTSTRILLWFADLFDKHAGKLAIGIILLIGTTIFLSKQQFFQPITHWIKLHAPIFGKLNRKIVMTRISRSLNSLLKSGIPIEQALEISASIIPNIYYKKMVKKSVPQIEKGQTLSESFKETPIIFDEMFIQILSLGEKTGGIEDSFQYLAEFYETEADDQMKNLSVSLEPILLIGVGLLVGFVAISILGPVYSITGSLR